MIYGWWIIRSLLLWSGVEIKRTMCQSGGRGGWSRGKEWWCLFVILTREKLGHRLIGKGSASEENCERRACSMKRICVFCKSTLFSDRWTPGGSGGWTVSISTQRSGENVWNIWNTEHKKIAQRGWLMRFLVFPSVQKEMPKKKCISVYFCLCHPSSQRTSILGFLCSPNLLLMKRTEGWGTGLH